jgi:mannose/cellobiose epimerase-like protein (N-acyl-D-glucosamine 2-epimerase family)
MTHVYALAALRGDGTAAPLVDHGIAALDGLLRDSAQGGWYASVDRAGRPVEATKAAYPHAFVVLAASSATLAGRPGAQALLGTALDVVLDRFWDDRAGRTVESWDASFREPEAYRGANSSMHMVEAFLAAGDATADPGWHRRALRICHHLVHEVAAAGGYRLPEHFTVDWQPVREYNADRPDHPFRPYGSTIGHWLEWARLLLHVEAALPDPPGWLLTDARALFDAAVATGWAVDGADGFVYTVDWHDRPVVRSRMHWVAAEAVAAAAALWRRTGEAGYARWYATFWDYIGRYLLDANGSWRHELDADNRPAPVVWTGRPDIYHAYQATLFPQLPLAPTAAAALAAARPPPA